MNDKYNDIIFKYINKINSLNYSIPKLKSLNDDDINNFIIMFNKLNEIAVSKEIYYFEIIKKIAEYNNGYILLKHMYLTNIPRYYYKVYEDKNLIEKVACGVYILADVINDDFFILQLKYNNMIYSHNTALYFWGLTEELPNVFTVSVVQGYNDKNLNKSCKIFYDNSKIFNLGVTKIKNNYGNEIRLYDKERCICDIIKNKNKLDFEQVKKSVIEYCKTKEKDINKLRDYSMKMKIYDKVFEFVGMYL